MVKANLAEEEEKLIIEALNSNMEPPPELTEKFDVTKLDRAKIVTLEYAGR